jgi:hypothetical protein
MHGICVENILHNNDIIFSHALKINTCNYTLMHYLHINKVSTEILHGLFFI